MTLEVYKGNSGLPMGKAEIGGGNIKADGALYQYMGSVPTYNDLLDLDTTDFKPGYVYDVQEDGMDYSWTGTEWNALGTHTDLSNYYTKDQTYSKSENDALLDTKIPTDSVTTPLSYSIISHAQESINNNSTVFWSKNPTWGTSNPQSFAWRSYYTAMLTTANGNGVINNQYPIIYNGTVTNREFRWTADNTSTPSYYPLEQNNIVLGNVDNDGKFTPYYYVGCTGGYSGDAYEFFAIDPSTVTYESFSFGGHLPAHTATLFRFANITSLFTYLPRYNTNLWAGKLIIEDNSGSPSFTFYGYDKQGNQVHNASSSSNPYNINIENINCIVFAIRYYGASSTDYNYTLDQWGAYDLQGNKLWSVADTTYTKYLQLNVGAGLAVQNGNLVNTNPTAPTAFTGADGTTAGAAGLVPAPAATDNNKFLKGDGTFAEVPTPDLTNYYNKAQTDGLLTKKQDILTPNNPLSITKYTKNNAVNMTSADGYIYGESIGVATYSNSAIYAESSPHIDIPYSLGEIIRVPSAGCTDSGQKYLIGSTAIAGHYYDGTFTPILSLEGKLTLRVGSFWNTYLKAMIINSQSSQNSFATSGNDFNTGISLNDNEAYFQIIEQAGEIYLYTHGSAYQRYLSSQWTASYCGTTTDSNKISKIRQINTIRVFPGYPDVASDSPQQLLVANNKALIETFALYNTDRPMTEYTNDTLPESSYRVADSSDYNYLDLHIGNGLAIQNNNLVNTNPTAPTVMTGATSSAAGASGLVPAPTAGDDTKFLAGDGTFKTVAAPDMSNYYTKTQADTLLDEKQDAFTTLAPIAIKTVSDSVKLVNMTNNSDRFYRNYNNSTFTSGFDIPLASQSGTTDYLLSARSTTADTYATNLSEFFSAGYIEIPFKVGQKLVYESATAYCDLARKPIIFGKYNAQGEFIPIVVPDTNYWMFISQSDKLSFEPFGEGQWSTTQLKSDKITSVPLSNTSESNPDAKSYVYANLNNGTLTWSFQDFGSGHYEGTITDAEDIARLQEITVARLLPNSRGSDENQLQYSSGDTRYWLVKANLKLYNVSDLSTNILDWDANDTYEAIGVNIGDGLDLVGGKIVNTTVDQVSNISRLNTSTGTKIPEINIDGTSIVDAFITSLPSYSLEDYMGTTYSIMTVNPSSITPLTEVGDVTKTYSAYVSQGDDLSQASWYEETMSSGMPEQLDLAAWGITFSDTAPTSDMYYIKLNLSTKRVLSASSSVPSNMVTTDTTQTISGSKTFNSQVSVNGTILARYGAGYSQRAEFHPTMNGAFLGLYTTDNEDGKIEVGGSGSSHYMDIRAPYGSSDLRINGYSYATTLTLYGTNINTIRGGNTYTNLDSGNGVSSTNIRNMERKTEAEYEALVQAGTVDANTFYVIVQSNS